MSQAFPDPFAIARIDEATCIGCALCVQACPTDAIVGAAKLMHTVIADRCTGCKLCLPPCPVDCIAMLPAARLWNSADAQRAQQHASARNARIAAGPRTRERQTKSQAALESTPLDTARQRRRAAVDAALARARARRVSRNLSGG